MAFLDREKIFNSAAKICRRLASHGDSPQNIESLFKETATYTLKRVLLGNRMSVREIEENDIRLNEIVRLISRNDVDPEKIVIGIIAQAAGLLDSVHKVDQGIAEIGGPDLRYEPVTRGNTVDHLIGNHDATEEVREGARSDITMFAYTRMRRYPVEKKEEESFTETPDSVTQYQELQREIALITGGPGGVVDLSMASGLPGMITRSLELRREIGNRVANYAQDQVFSDLRTGL